ncbi:MAG: protein-L-isoaspartate O-methyltransferase [Halobacteriaceae archaeon]
MDPPTLRDDMVEGLRHESKGVLRSDRLALAMGEVDRHEFLDVDPSRAYLDRAFSHRGTTVLAPATVARLLEALSPSPDDEVLVVGAGVGYTAAVLAELVGARRVHAVDITRDVVYDARHNLARAGYEDVLVDCRDGAQGLPGYAPFDRVLVEAAAVGPPAALVRQLAPGGRLVMPRGTVDQTLVAVEPTANGGHEVAAEFGPAGFKPLLVEGEQHGAVERNRTAREDREFAEMGYFARKGWEYDWIDWDAQS